MSRSSLTGSRIRERRTVLRIKQADLARQVGISASYLNLIEHNRRRIGGKLLLQIARSLSVEASQLTEGAEAGLLDQLNEAASANKETAAEMDRIEELVGRFPGWAGLLVVQQQRIASLEHRAAELADRLTHDPFLSAALHEVLSKASSIRSTAAILDETEDLDPQWQGRFKKNLHEDSRKLAEGASALVDYLDAGTDAEPGAASAQEELEGFLQSSAFHVAGLERALPATPESLIGSAENLQSNAAKEMAIPYLQRYRNEAVRMPLADFTAAAVEEGYDPAKLSLRFGVDMPAIFRRLASLPDASGHGPIGMVVCNGAGALVLRKETPGFPVPRFGSACPLWPLYQALTRPMAPIRARVTHSASPGQVFLTYAICQPGPVTGFDGPQVYEASMLILPPGLAEATESAGRLHQVGTACRVCSLPECPARGEPSVLADGFDSGA